MTFLNTVCLWHLIWIVPLFIVLWAVGASRARHKIARIFPNKELVQRFSDLSPAKRNLRIFLLACAVLCTVLACARPTWGKQIVPETSSGHDLLVVFDVSRSMLADDVKPNRFAHAKWVVRELVKQNPGDRFGLIAFAGTAFLSCPLTADRTSFTQLVDELDTSSIPIGGTNVQIALETAVKAFAGAEGTHKAVILVTDGDELEGRGASVITDLKVSGIPLIIAGIGDPTVPSIIRVPDENGGTHILTDAEGNAVKSPLNEEQLGALARSTNGIYVRSTAAEDGLEHLEARIRMLDRKENKDELGMFRPIERPVYPIAAALFFLALFLCIPETRKLYLILAVCLAGLQLEAKQATPASIRAALQRANQPAVQQTATAPTAVAADSAQPDEPEQPAEDAAAAQPGKKKPVSATELFNRGLADQTEKHDNESAKTNYELSVALAQKEPVARASSYQNLGVLAHQNANADLQAAMESVQNQDLDTATKSVTEALQKLNQAEEHYCESMRSVPGTANPSIVRNQQILLNDRKKAEDLRDRIEELKRMQQQAQQQAQQALEQQQKENQPQDQQQQQQQDQQQQQQDGQQQDQQQQDQQNQQDQQQDGQQQDQQQQDQQQQQQDQQQQDGQQQNQQDQQQDQQSAAEKTQQAKESASDLEQKASEMNQEQLQQAAQKAKDELEKAQEAQSKGDGESAEEHLQNAYDALNQFNANDHREEGDSDQARNQEGEGNREEDRKETADDEQEDSKSEERKEEQHQAAEAQEADQQPIDKQQAEAILNAMNNDEKDAREAVRRLERNSSYGRVEKDW